MTSHSVETGKLTVIARAPFEVFYEGPAESVTSRNKIGKFDILPGHADFFSMLEAGEIIVRSSDNEIKLPINNGILTARDDKVMIFIDM